MQFEGENIPLKSLPKPTGWRVIIGMYKIQQQTSGGIILTDDHVKSRQYLRNVGKVLAVGELCYTGERFSGNVPVEHSEPKAWVKAGDVVLIRELAGQPIHLSHDGEIHCVKALNDDEILAIVDDTSILSV